MRTLEIIGHHRHFFCFVFAFILACLRIFYIMDVSKSAFLQGVVLLPTMQAPRGPLASQFNYHKTFCSCLMAFLGFPRSCAINLSPTETFCISFSQNNWEENYVHVILVGESANNSRICAVGYRNPLLLGLAPYSSDLGQLSGPL